MLEASWRRNIIHTEPTQLFSHLHLHYQTEEFDKLAHWKGVETCHLSVRWHVNTSAGAIHQQCFPLHCCNYNKPWVYFQLSCSPCIEKEFVFFIAIVAMKYTQHLPLYCIKNIMQGRTPAKQFDGRLNIYHNRHTCFIYLLYYTAYYFTKIWQLQPTQVCRDNTA